MEQTPELSPKKTSSEIEVTKELIESFKGKAQGKYPKHLRSKILQYTDPKHRNIKKVPLVRKDKDGNIVVREKLDAFLEELLKNDGNATEAAMAVFNVSSRSSAAQVGAVYLKKAQVLARVLLEKKGYTYGRLLEIAGEKAERSSQPDWWDRVMSIAGYGEFLPSRGPAPVNNINIIQTEKELFKKYAMQDAEVIEEETINVIE